MWAIIDRYLTSLAVQIFGITIAILGTSEKLSNLGEDITGFMCVIGVILFFYGLFLFIRAFLFMIHQIKLKLTHKPMLCREYGWITGLICAFRNDYIAFTITSKKSNFVRLITRVIGILCVCFFVAVTLRYIFVNDIHASTVPITIATILLIIGIVCLFQSKTFLIEPTKDSHIKSIPCSSDFTMEHLFEEIKNMQSEYGIPHLETKEDIISPVIVFGPKIETLDYLYILKNKSGNKFYIGKSTAENYTFEEQEEEIFSDKTYTQEEIYQEVKQLAKQTL